MEGLTIPFRDSSQIRKNHIQSANPYTI